MSINPNLAKKGYFMPKFPYRIFHFLLECVVVDEYFHPVWMPVPSHVFIVVFIRSGLETKKKFESYDFLQHKDYTVLAVIFKQIELQK